MAEANYFTQECPTCGRNLRIRVEYLGKSVVCQHCHGSLVARDPHASRPAAGLNAAGCLLQRAAVLIDLADRRLPR